MNNQINSTIEEDMIRAKECKRCKGSGAISVANGRDDYDLTPCECKTK